MPKTLDPEFEAELLEIMRRSRVMKQKAPVLPAPLTAGAAVVYAGAVDGTPGHKVVLDAATAAVFTAAHNWLKKHLDKPDDE